MDGPRQLGSMPSSLDSASLREAAALLLLTRAGREVGTRHVDEVESRGSALEVLRRVRLCSAAQTSLFHDPEAELVADLAAAECELGDWSAQGMRFLSVLDDAYPELLRSAHDRPAWLLVAGRLKPRDERAVAVIGTREPTPEGLRDAEDLAGRLARGGYTVVSGLASGIDTAAHAAALSRGGRTLAVIGTGLSRCYPRGNVILQRRIAAQCAVVSQFTPETPPDKQNFRQRNALISGLSLATVIVEASAYSGTRIAARAALSQARPVFVYRRLLKQRWARELADEAAVTVVDEPAEITVALERLTSTAALVA